MRLLLIRHGQSVSNAEARMQGHLNIPLSDRGVRESELLAERLAGMPVAALYTSPLQRARRTAETVGQRLGLPVSDRDFLMERDLGALAGLTRDEIIAQFPDWQRPVADAEARVPGYEPDASFVDRVVPNLLSLVSEHDDDTIAVFTHGGVIGAFTRHLLDIPLRRTFTVSNASVSIFQSRNGPFGPQAGLQVVALNDTCHLRKA